MESDFSGEGRELCGEREPRVIEQPTGQDVEALRRENEALRAEIIRLKEEAGYTRLLFENSFDAIIIADDTGRYLQANEAAARLLGYPRERLLQMSASDLMVPADQPPAGEDFEAYKTAGWKVGEYRFIDGHGREKVMIYSAQEIAPGLHRSIMRDVTEQARLRSLLGERELLLKALGENDFVAIVQTGADGGVTFVNQAYCRMTGLTPEEAAGFGWLRAIHPDDLEAMKSRVAGFSASEDTAGTFEYRYLNRRTGDTIWAFAQGIRLRNPAGEVSGFISVVIDITERKRTEEDLRRSITLREAIFEASSDALFLVDSVTLLTVECNQRAVELFEVADKSALIGIDGRTLHRRPPTVDQANAIVKAILERSSWTGEFEYVTARGREFWGDVAVRVIVWDDLVYQLVRIADITTRKQAELALRESEQRFSTFFKAIPLACSVSTVSDGRFVEVNEASARLSGYSVEETIGRTSVELGLWIDESERTELIDRLVKSGAVSMHEVRTRNRWGEPLDLLLSAVVIDIGGTAHLLTVTHDVSELKKTQRALVQSETRQRQIIRNTPDRIFMLDREGRFTFLNRISTRRRMEDVLGVPFWNFVHEEDASRCQQCIEIAFITGELNECEIRTLDPDRRIAWYSIRAVPFGDKPYAEIMLIAQNITERKSAEAKIRATLAEKEVLLREIHHRVKNNLQIISSLIDLHLVAEDDPRIEAFKADVRNRVGAMALIHESLYRPETVGVVEMTRFADMLVENLVLSFRARGIAATVAGPSAALPFDTAVPLGLIVNELATNAFKHAFPDGRDGAIEVAFQPGPDCLEVTVTDNGVGLPAGYIPRSGDSLGLRLVELLALQIDGTVNFMSDGGGTRATIIIPFSPGG